MAGEIADKSGLKNNTAAKYIHELVNYYDILEPVHDFFSTTNRGKRYRIKDNFLAFWFRAIYSHYDIVEFNPESAFLFTKENLMSRVGYVFEDIIKSSLHLLFKNGLIPFLPDTVGKTWGKVPNEKGKSYEMDIIGEKNNQLLVIECKWREKQVDDKQINHFLRNCSYLKTKKEIIPVFISKTGFKNPDNFKNKSILLDKNDIMQMFDSELTK
jgi:AAA+ ATPase superfamily predicted ATPase